MNILTFDTTFDKTYITLSLDGKLTDSIVVNSDNEKYHSAYLMSNIAKILKKHNILMTDIDKIATNVGPGSFTGIRVCTTAAKIISQQTGVDVYGISSTEILSQLNKNNTKTLVALDARRGKFYLHLFDENGTEQFAPAAFELDKLKELALLPDVTIICDKAVKEILTDRETICYEDGIYDLGACLAQIVQKKVQQDKEPHQWYKLEPLYIQPPPITLKK